MIENPSQRMLLDESKFLQKTDQMNFATRNEAKRQSRSAGGASELKQKMRALSIGCTGMNERCTATRNLDFANDTPEKQEEVPEILSDSSRAYI